MASPRSLSPHLAYVKNGHYRSIQTIMPSLRTPSRLRLSAGLAEWDQRLNRGGLQAWEERAVARVTEIEERLLVRRGVCKLRGRIVARAPRYAQGDRVQVVALHHTAIARDGVVVHVLDIIRGEWVRG